MNKEVLNIFPGGMNPENMKRVMKQMGIKTEEIPAKKAVFELEGKNLVIENPQITAMTVQGQKTYTVMGNTVEEAKELEIPKEDIEMVSSTAGVSAEKAEKALKESSGDLAKAIEELKK
ncbi:MAG: nascent polypeptide-associated complex protein [Candidatus Diapherotrites archaeon]